MLSPETANPHPLPFSAILAACLSAAGSLALYPMWASISVIWSSDPLRSIGAIFPIVSLILIGWRWRTLDFRADGTYWGMLPIVLSIFGARVFNAARLEVLIEGHRVGLLHPGMVLLCYGVGCTLLFGGLPLLRRAIFPLCLLVALNPVPHAFNTLVDLPLQTLSANTARAFSHLIGLRPTGAQLKMMFAPDFGMMIVPGCNGVRGSITLGYLALIFGYTRRLPARALAVLALGGFLMGYALNLTRLCVLVIYYKIGLTVTSIQKYGVEIDYVIGCTIFLCATLAIGIAVRTYQARTGHVPPSEDVISGPTTAPASGAYLRAACFVLVAILFIVPQLKAIQAARQPAPTAQEVIAALPPQVGGYRLTRTWTEHDTNNQVNLVLGDYAATEAGKPGFTLGLWMGGSNHFVANSKLYQGIRPVWTGAFDASAEGNFPVHFVSNFYDDGVNRSYDAETACSSGGCRETLVNDPNTGVVFSSPKITELAIAHAERRLPILLRREWSDDATPPAALRQQFEADAASFVAHLELAPILQHAGNF